MVFPCGSVFAPVITPIVQAVVHVKRHVCMRIGHHVIHPVRHAVHAATAHPAAMVVGFACRTAPGWVAAGLLALPLVQPAPSLSDRLPWDVPGLQAQDGATPTPMLRSTGLDSPTEGSTGATLAPQAASEGSSAVTPPVASLVVPVRPGRAPLPLPPAGIPATRPYQTVPPEVIVREIALHTTGTPQAVPEPSSLLVLTTGFYSLIWLRRGRQALVTSRT